MRRAARWDGAVPLFGSSPHGELPPAEEVRELVGYVREHAGERDQPFDVVVGGATPADPDQARDLIAPMVDAGATWWDERQRYGGDGIHRMAPVLRRVEQGPPAR